MFSCLFSFFFIISNVWDPSMTMSFALVLIRVTTSSYNYNSGGGLILSWCQWINLFRIFDFEVDFDFMIFKFCKKLTILIWGCLNLISAISDTTISDSLSINLEFNVNLSISASEVVL